jgi:arylsulfatase A-like enzyme
MRPLASAWAVALVPSLLAAPACAPRRPPPPDHIVFIVIDTLRRDHLPVYGYGKETAPFLAQLAEQGVVFDATYTTAAWTGPATASIFTGVYPFQHGLITGVHATERMQAQDASVELNRIPEGLVTLPEAMKQAGYATYGITENPNIVGELGFAAGFDHFQSFPYQKDARLILGKLLEWQPVLLAEPRSFLYLHFMDPHGPYEKKRPWFKRFKDAESDRRAVAYDSEIAYADAHLRKAAEALGWEDRALVLVTADHGELLGEHSSWGHGHNLYAPIMNVPLLLVFPDRWKAGTRVEEAVSHVDLLPTLRDIAGLETDPSTTGRSLLPLLEGRRLPPRPLLAHTRRRAAESGQDKLLRVVVDGEWKLISREPGGPLLFRRSDREELEDLAAQQPDRVDALLGRYQELDAALPRFAGDRQRIDLDAAALDRLRVLGYVD